MVIELGPRSIIWIGVILVYFLNLIRFDSTVSGGWFPSSDRGTVAAMTLPLFAILGLLAQVIYLEVFK